MKRKPSLRELRGKLPGNVVILPVAAERQVKQQFNSGVRAARKALREPQKRSFSFKHGGVREAEKLARAMLEVDGNPAVILAHAILVQLDKEARVQVVEALQKACALSPSSRGHFQAYAVAKTTVQTHGEHADLERAFRILEARE
jgi:hypothetical protein